MTYSLFHGGTLKNHQTKLFSTETPTLYLYHMIMTMHTLSFAKIVQCIGKLSCKKRYYEKLVTAIVCSPTNYRNQNWCQYQWQDNTKYLGQGSVGFKKIIMVPIQMFGPLMGSRSWHINHWDPARIKTKQSNLVWICSVVMIQRQTCKPIPLDTSIVSSCTSIG